MRRCRGLLRDRARLAGVGTSSDPGQGDQRKCSGAYDFVRGSANIIRDVGVTNGGNVVRERYCFPRRTYRCHAPAQGGAR